VLWSYLRSNARNIRVHPVRDELAEQQTRWDGIPRVHTWLTRICGAADTPYTRAVGAKWLIAAVRRVRQPGCKFDHILILEGGQGIGKSTIFSVLAGTKFFTDNLSIGLDPKEVIELTKGRWISELAELTDLNKRDVEAVKAFITRQQDEARMAYGREVLEVPRQFVLAATTNRSRYLRDDSGDRRFWTIACTGVIDTGQSHLPLMLDIDGLRQERDQLWAEAAVREAQGEAIHLPPEIEAPARIEQAKRFDADDRQQLLEDLLEDKNGFVPTHELYKAIGVTDIENKHPGLTKIITAAMSRLSWTRDRQRVGTPSKQVRGWLSPGAGDEVLTFFWGGDGRFEAGARDAYGSRDEQD
jgi:predicted P-loop ATPase